MDERGAAVAMSLLARILVISGSMILLCLLPIFSAGIRRYSRFFYLVGTGALFGICVFDLLPDIFELGGRSSLMVMGAVWCIYSLIHLLHLRHHDQSHDRSEQGCDVFQGHSHHARFSVFLLPSVHLMRKTAWNAGWIAVGLLMTQLVLKGL